MSERKRRRQAKIEANRSNPLSNLPFNLDMNAVDRYGWGVETTVKAITRAINELVWLPRMTVTEATKGEKSIKVLHQDLIRYMEKQDGEEGDGKETFSIASGRQSDNIIYLLGGGTIQFNTEFSLVRSDDWIGFLAT